MIYGRNSIYYAPILYVSKRLSAISGSFLFIATNDIDYDYVCSYFAGCENIKICNFGNDFTGHERMLRFLAPQCIQSKYYHFRDSDSIITEAELGLISVFELSSYPFMLIRNHPLHFSPIMAGMFSLNSELANELVDLVLDRKIVLNNSPYYDQTFLTKVLYMPNYKCCLIMSSCICFSGEKVSAISFDKYNFVGMPNHWSKEDCNNSLALSKGALGQSVITIPFYPLISDLYQRTRFIWCLIKMRKILTGFYLICQRHHL